MQIPLIVRHILASEILKCGGNVHLIIAEIQEIRSCHSSAQNCPVTTYPIHNKILKLYMAYETLHDLLSPPYFSDNIFK